MGSVWAALRCCSHTEKVYAMTFSLGSTKQAQAQDCELHDGTNPWLELLVTCMSRYVDPKATEKPGIAIACSQLGVEFCPGTVLWSGSQ